MSLLDGYEDIFANPISDAAMEEMELKNIEGEIAFENMNTEPENEIDSEQAAFESNLAELDKILAQESKGIKDVHLDDSDTAYIMGEEDDTPDDDIHFDDADDIGAESLNEAMTILKENHEYLMATEGTDPAMEASADDLLKRSVDERAIINFLNGLEKNKGWSIASDAKQLEKAMASVRSKQFTAMNIAMTAAIGYANTWGNASALEHQKSTEVKMIGGKAVGLSRNASNGRVTTIWVLVTKDGRKLKLKWFSYKKVLKSDFSETGSISTDSVDPLQAAISNMYAALEGNDNEVNLDAEEGEGEFDIDDDEILDDDSDDEEDDEDEDEDD